MASNPGRVGHAWRALQARVFAEEQDCYLCGAWVDQTLPHNDRMARSVDHVIALANGGDPLSRANARLAHRKCNSAKADAPARPAEPQRSPSRQWVSPRTK